MCFREIKAEAEQLKASENNLKRENTADFTNFTTYI